MALPSPNCADADQATSALALVYHRRRGRVLRRGRHAELRPHPVSAAFEHAASHEDRAKEAHPQSAKLASSSSAAKANTWARSKHQIARGA